MVPGKQVAQGKIDRTVPTRFSADETLDVGEDVTPVVEDYVGKMPFKFTGDLKKVVIELSKSGLTASDEKKLEEGPRLCQKLVRRVMSRKRTDKETALPPISGPADRGQFHLVRASCPTCPDSSLWWGATCERLSFSTGRNLRGSHRRMSLA